MLSDGALGNFIKVVPRFLSLHVAASTSSVMIQSVGRITPRGRKIWLNSGEALALVARNEGGISFLMVEVVYAR